MLRAGNHSAFSRQSPELVFYLLFSLYTHAIHKTAGISVGITSSGGQWVSSPLCHKPPPPAQQQYEHRASDGPAEHLEWDSVEGGCASTHSQDKRIQPFEHHGLKSHVQGCDDHFPSPSSIAQGNTLPTVSRLPTISSLVIYIIVHSKYQDRVPASEQTQTLLQAFTESVIRSRGLNRIVVKRKGYDPGLSHE